MVKKNLTETLANKILYHASLANVSMLNNNAQGIHLSQDLEGAKDLAESRSWKDYILYKVYLKNNLHPIASNIDVGYWDAKNISQAIINKNIVIPNIKDTDLGVFAFFADFDNGKSSKRNLEQIRDIFNRYGYDSIIYPNETEINTNYDSVMLFDNSVIDKIEQINLR